MASGINKFPGASFPGGAQAPKNSFTPFQGGADKARSEILRPGGPDFLVRKDGLGSKSVSYRAMNGEVRHMPLKKAGVDNNGVKLYQVRVDDEVGHLPAAARAAVPQKPVSLARLSLQLQLGFSAARKLADTNSVNTYSAAPATAKLGAIYSGSATHAAISQPAGRGVVPTGRAADPYALPEKKPLPPTTLHSFEDDEDLELSQLSPGPALW